VAAASAVLAGVLLVATPVACRGGAGGRSSPVEADGVRIASFDFDESALVAELYAQTLEAAGIPVFRLGVIGPREVIAPALEQGLIDLVPEYLGTAGNHFGSASVGVAPLTAALEPRGLVVLEPAPAQDVNVLVVLEATASALDLTSTSDLSAAASTMRIGGPVECPARPLCLDGLRTTYGIEFAEFVPERTLAATAEALQREEIDVGVMFSTAPEIGAGPFVVLDDDLGLQPPDNVVPLLRAATIERWGPELAQALDRVSARLTTDELRTMNARVSGGDTIDETVADWIAGVSPRPTVGEGRGRIIDR
jgi:osmoprotectant transport system substrate-binding protein